QQVQADEEAAEDLTYGDANGEHHGVRSNCSRLRFARELQLDDRQYLGRHDGSRCALYTACHDERSRRRRQPASERRHGEPAAADAHKLVFGRRGCFVRTIGGIESVYDPCVAYCTNPTEEEHFDRPHTDGDDCTAISVDPALVASLWGDQQTLPSGPIPTSPQ